MALALPEASGFDPAFLPAQGKACPWLTSKTLLSISPRTLGPSVRRDYDCADTALAKLLLHR
jgi:hypothetical protein